MRRRWRHGPPWGEGPPPWWPEGEAWPPRRRWGHGPGPFFMRMGLVLLGGLFLFNLVVASVVWLVARALGASDVPAAALVSVTAAALLLVIGIVGVGSVVRTLRGAAAPIGEVMEAAERLAEGDRSVRVRVRGPREVRRLGEAFNAMAERLERAEQHRRRLLADVTHELRTPLAVVQGQLEGALDGVYPRDDEHLGAILDATRHVARLIDDLRTLSLAESGALELRREPTAIDEIVDDVVDAYAPQATVAGVTLTSTVPPDLPTVDVDPTRIREVLHNLLSNALRYTPAGGEVTVGARRYGLAHVRVTIRDTGRGVAPEELPRIFERFERSADSRGSGLGLAIARDLVRAHGGEIAAESAGDGRGTTVRFTVPLAT